MFSLNNFKKNDKIIYKYFKDKYGRRSKFWVSIKNVDEARNDLAEETKHNDLMSEKYEKTCKYLNYVKHLFILASIVNGLV